MDHSGVRVVLIGGTSHVGKSTLAGVLATSLGWRHLSTDGLARHPGRPWGTVPDHVRNHYSTLTVPELTSAQLEHYERMWPTILAAVEGAAVEGAAVDGAPAAGGPGLVLEGSGIWPDRVAGLTLPGIAAFWLTADGATLGRRIHTESRFAELAAAEQLLVTRFIGRTVRYDGRLRVALRRLGLAGIDVSASPAPDRLAGRLRDHIARSRPA